MYIGSDGDCQCLNDLVLSADGLACELPSIDTNDDGSDTDGELNANLVRDEPKHCIPHTTSQGKMVELLGGGDGTKITCRALTNNGLPCPLGDGNGRLPPGITFNASTCTHSGGVLTNRRGTWVWIVEVEQSGFTAYVPFCASQDDDTFHDITLTINSVEESDLNPGLFEFAPNNSLAFGNGTHNWQVENPACVTNPPLCNSYGFKYNTTCSPFDPPYVLNGQSTQLGITHGMTVTGPPPNSSFATRPFVFSVEIQYCTSSNGADCDVDTSNFESNAQTKYHYDVIGFPAL